MSGRREVNTILNNIEGYLYNFSESESRNSKNRKLLLKINDILYFINDERHIMAIENEKQRSVGCTELFGLREILSEKKHPKYKDMKQLVEYMCEKLELEGSLGVFLTSDKNGSDSLRVELTSVDKKYNNKPIIDFETSNDQAFEVVKKGLKRLTDSTIVKIYETKNIKEPEKLVTRMINAFNLFSTSKCMDKTVNNRRS